MKYCSFCGKQLAEEEKCTCAGAVEAQKPTIPKNIKKLVIPVAIILIVVIAVVCVVSFRQTEIDLTPYVEIEGVSGLNGKGVIEYGLLEGPLMDALWEENDVELTEENYEEVMAENWATLEQVDRAVACITVTADKETGLSNGDVVTITASFDNPDNHKFPYHFKDTSVQYTVAGLKDGKMLDLFSEDVFSLSFTGFNGTGEASVEILTQDEVYEYVRYELSVFRDLTNGDSVTVSARFNENQLEELGYFVPDETEATYTVEGLTEYLTDPDVIPAADMEELKQILMDYMQVIVEDDVNEYNILTHEPELLGTYFASTGDPSVMVNDYWYGLHMQNAVVVLGHLTTEYIGFMGYVSDYWIAMVYPNCYIDDAGNFVYEDNVEDLYMEIGSEEELIPAFESLFPEMSVVKIG